MKILVPILLAITLLSLGAGKGWGNEFQKGYEAFDKDDFQTAGKIFKRLARQGDPRSQYYLGYLYRLGFGGILKDYLRSAMWLNISRSKGYKPAETFLHAMEKNLSPHDVVVSQQMAKKCLESNYRRC